MVNGSPQIMPLAVDLYEHLVKVPAPMTKTAHPVHTTPVNLSREHRAKRFHQTRTVSWQMSTPRSDNRSSTFRSDSGYRTYGVTAIRIISGDELKQRNGLATSLIFPFYQHSAPSAILV